MPYIGQRPATGEANSFKILDEISSYTLSFDGSSADVVSLANDTITEREHRFVTGQRVTYNDGGGTAITGLSDGVYYIIVEDRHTFKLASSANNAASGTAINLQALGVGTPHTINVAFDGVNTKFKATINNGNRARITASGQLMLSINGVLQEPHDNTASPPTGYATDHTSTIIFSAAPAATDQFFGRLIASNFATFDISDNVVDNFTGDGSTSTFTLSKSPPNNESILVTIDGVVQYPDDNDAVRAYTVSENILDFASAPGNDVEIQVRHIGFAGASSDGITGFYGRTGNAVLKNTDNIVFNDATASGDIQAANVTVTGDLTVNGTTTTLDTELTSVDKLEVAANNTTVAAAITQTGTGDILNLYDGAAEVFSVTDGGVVRVPDNGKFNAGAGDDLQIYHDGSNSSIQNTTGYLYLYGGTNNILIRAKNDENGIIVKPNDSVELFYNNTKMAYTSSSGFDVTNGDLRSHLNIKVLNDNQKLLLGAGNDLQLYHDGSHSYIDNNTGSLRFRDAGGAEKFRISGSGTQFNDDITLSNDGDKLNLGAGSDLSLWHDGSHSYFKNTTNYVYYRSTQHRFQNAAGTENQALFFENAGVELYYNNSKKLETQSGGVLVTGYLQTTTILYSNEILSNSATNDDSSSHVSISARNAAGGYGNYFIVGTSGNVYFGAGANNYVANPAGTNTQSATTIRVNEGISSNAYNDAHRFGRNGDGTIMIFMSAGGAEGSVSISGNTTSYNTSSDYRLKENIVDISDGITRLKQLKPRRFNFIKNPSTTKDGFIAHEVSSIVPEAVQGTKDETYIKDEDINNIKAGDPKYQSMDAGKLIPLLTAALQEAVARIETLEARVATLEGS